jgi:hypothetical protein
VSTKPGQLHYAVGIFIFVVACVAWFPTELIGRATFGVAVLLFLFCTVDSISLRSEIKKLTTSTTPPLAAAHVGVYTRLQKSSHGVGVFAIRDIPEGTNVFAGDDNEIREIDKNDFANVQPEIKKLYEDFCVWQDGKVKGPSNFNNLTVGWYLNHSDTPNVDFIATREIKMREELTADYTKYDERPLNFTPCSASD